MLEESRVCKRPVRGQRADTTLAARPSCSDSPRVLEKQNSYSQPQRTFLRLFQTLNSLSAHNLRQKFKGYY